MAKAGDTYRMMPAMHDASKKYQSMQAALESWVMSHMTNGGPVFTPVHVKTVACQEENVW